MKKLLTLALLLSATTLFAEGPVKRTIVIRDGKVISNTEGGPDVFRFDSELLGGKRPHLGVRLTDLSDELREHFGAPKDSGLLVASVEENSPADKANVRVGDIIVSVDGKDVLSVGDLRSALREKKDGDSVRIEVLRGRARQTLVASVVVREGMRMMAPGQLEGLREFNFNSPEWKARLESLGDCGGLQTRIKELETRLKDLEKKLQK